MVVLLGMSIAFNFLAVLAIGLGAWWFLREYQRTFMPGLRQVERATDQAVMMAMGQQEESDGNNIAYHPSLLAREYGSWMSGAGGFPPGEDEVVREMHADIASWISRGIAKNGMDEKEEAA